MVETPTSHQAAFAADDLQRFDGIEGEQGIGGTASVEWSEQTA